MPVEVVASGGALGAEIRGVDLAAGWDEALAATLRRALQEHMVLFARDQRLGEKAQVHFTKIFGDPVEHVRRQPDRPVKEIFLISNIRRDGEPIGALGHGTIPFHSDLSYMERPGTVSVLYAVEVPSAGGGTQWCNCHAAYEALDEDTRQRLHGLEAVHRHPVPEQNPPEPVQHPVVRLHPADGRRSLYVSPHLTSHIVGLGEAESRRLLDDLYAHMEEPRFVWTHAWRPGDLVVWDNRPTMHRRLAFDPGERRLMKRTQVFNAERPLAG